MRDAVLMGWVLPCWLIAGPTEGLVISLPVAAALLIWMVRQRKLPAMIWGRRVVLPLLLVLTVTGGAMGYYFWRVTGNHLSMPYQVIGKLTAVARYFLWQPPYPQPVYHHVEMRDFDNAPRARAYVKVRSVVGFLKRGSA